MQISAIAYFATLGPEERPILSQVTIQPAGPPFFSEYSKWNISSTTELIFLNFELKLSNPNQNLKLV
jgi:hypothetical protein